MAVLGLHCCQDLFSSCVEPGLPNCSVWLLTVVASLVAELRL